MTALATYMSEIEARVTALRERLRVAAPEECQTLLEAGDLRGEVYVESLGTVVFINEAGSAEFFYPADGLRLRDHALLALGPARAALFESLAKRLPSRSRVLVIGAGGDVAPIRGFQAAGHEVIATDFAEETTRVLGTRIDVPTFACDLQFLDEVLVEGVDFVFGNSTLGYIDPRKVESVVANISSVATAGALFTFDMTPHPHYFHMAEETEVQALLNASAPDPRKLLEYIESLGVNLGIAAMTLHSYYRSLSVNLATVGLLKERFNRLGDNCVTSYQTLQAAGGGLAPLVLLRVGSREALETVLDNERVYEDPSEILEDDSVKPMLFLSYIDREIGEPLARKLGIHRSRKADPWLVARHVANHVPSEDELARVRAGVLEDINPQRFAERIARFVDGAPFYPPTQRPMATYTDQHFHNSVLSGTLPIDETTADMHIDAAYRAGRDKRIADRTRAGHSTNRAARKTQKKRKQQRKSRKKNRNR